MRSILILTVALLAVAACGGSDSDAEPENATTTTEAAAQTEDDEETTTTQEAAERDEEEEAGEEPAPASEVSMAVVTLGDSTYEFSSSALGAQCRSGFILLYMADENGDLLLVNDQTSHVNIQSDYVEVVLAADDTTWEAEEDDIDALSFEGDVLTPTVEGSATFENSSGEQVSGTFEAACAE